MYVCYNILGSDMVKKLYLYMFLFVLVDQVSKNLVDFYITLNNSISIIPNFFSLTYVRNIGAAFSLLKGSRYFLIIASIIALNIIFLYFIKGKKLSNYNLIVYSMLLGGILGNLIDRILYGYVIDFLDFTIFGFDFAIFNLADTFIVISIILIVIGEIYANKSRCK